MQTMSAAYHGTTMATTTLPRITHSTNINTNTMHATWDPSNDEPTNSSAATRKEKKDFFKLGMHP